MRGIRAVVVLIFCSGLCLPGCLSFGEDSNTIELEVNYNTLNGTVIESYLDGELTSLESFEVIVDFSETKSETKLEKVGIEFDDDREPIEVEFQDETSIIVSFSEIYLKSSTLLDSLTKSSFVKSVPIQLWDIAAGGSFVTRLNLGI